MVYGVIVESGSCMFLVEVKTEIVFKHAKAEIVFLGVLELV